MTVPTPNSHFDTSPEAQSERGRRPKGASRAKLAQRFFESTYTAWEEQGTAALRRAAFHDPMGFCNMIARLMPQKIEHVTPTDGMTDERLAQLLDLAEGMLRLRASHPHLLDHENGLIDVSPTKGGGGPERGGVAAGGGSTSTIRDTAAGGGSTSTIRDTAADRPNQPLNPLKPDWAPNSEQTYTPEQLDVLTPVRRKLEETDSIYDDRTPVTPFRSENDIPHPVGRPFPKEDHVVSAANRRGLELTAEGVNEERSDEVDPASLF
jgi:hypothetical protein